MITSIEIRDIITEEIYEHKERLTQKELASALGYHRWTIVQALHHGKFSISLLRRFAFVFPSLKQNPTYTDIIKQSK